MQSQTNAQTKIAFGRPVIGWTEADLAKLVPLMSGIHSRDDLLRAAPGRTISAIRTKLYYMRLAKLRDQVKRPVFIGKQEPMLNPDEPALLTDEGASWRRKAVVANRRFLEAIARMSPCSCVPIDSGA